jgi:hypothetical protein
MQRVRLSGRRRQLPAAAAKPTLICEATVTASAPGLSRMGIRLEVSRGPLAVRATWQISAVTVSAAWVRKLLMANAGRTR